MKFIHIFLIVSIILNFNLLKADEIKTENKIAKNLRCLICQGQSVYDSDSEFAISLKLVIKNKIQLTNSIIDLKQFDNVFLIAVGKSAGIMAEFTSKKIPIKNGLVIVPKGITPKLKKSVSIGRRNLVEKVVVNEIIELYVPIYEARLIGPKKNVRIMRIDGIRKKVL